jgi:hypothetical protein
MITSWVTSWQRPTKDRTPSDTIAESRRGIAALFGREPLWNHDETTVFGRT